MKEGTQFLKPLVFDLLWIRIYKTISNPVFDGSPQYLKIFLAAGLIWREFYVAVN